MRRALVLLPCLIACLADSRAAGPHPSLPPPVVPECLGVNIHFTDPKPGEMEMLAAAGFKWVRMDFTWASTERKPGEYDFSAYDRLVAALDKHKLRALFILDYGNPLYAEPGDKHPFTSRAGTPEFREAFAKWAVAVVTHFKGRGYLWELWNEPNIAGFWKPQPNAADYTALAKSTGEALRKAGLIGEKGEAFIGPATSTIDLAFIEECFKAGLLEYWDAVSVHPYRQTAPETVEEEYRSLRLLIRRYAPAGKDIPIISGEWGYSTQYPAFAGKDAATRDEQQAKWLARQFLTNIANDVALSIWYDWRDDGTNPTEPEHHFGIVRNEYHAGRDPVYDPKPAYTAMKTLTEQLGGMRFNKRLQHGWPGFIPLLFTAGETMRIAFWSGSYRPPTDWIPCSPGEFTRRTHLGEAGPSVVVRENETPDFKVTDAPNYFTPQKPNDILRLAAAWDRFPLELIMDPDKPNTFSYTVANPLGRPLAIDASAPGSRPLAPGDRRVVTVPFGPSRQERTVASMGFIVPGFCHLSQTTVLIASSPLRIVPLPVMGEALPVRLENPSGHAFRGGIEVYFDGSGDTPEFGPIARKPARKSLAFKEGDKEQTLVIPLGATPPAAYCGVIRIYEGSEGFLGKLFRLDELDRAQEQVASGSIWFKRLDELGAYSNASFPAAYQAHPDGDAAVSIKSDLTITSAPPGLPISDVPALRLKYAFGVGWKFLRLMPSTEKLKQIHGIPISVGWWVFGDGQGCALRIRFTDRNGQFFQANGPKVDWRGWRYINVPVRSPNASFAGSKCRPLDSVTHWGGPNDGMIDGPIKWDSIFLLDNVSRQPVEGEIYLSAPTLIY